MRDPDDISGDIPGDLPPIDPDLAAWLASDPAPAMPGEVWETISARLAAEPPLIASRSVPADDSAQVIDLGAERVRRRSRALPVLAGAAGLVLVGAVVVPSMRSADPAPVADGVSPSAPLLAVPAPGGSAKEAAPSGVAASAPANPEGAGATVAEPVVPRAIVATGTDYTAEALPAQVVTLIADAGMADGISVATAMTASPSTTAMPGSGLAASPEALADCLTRLGLTPDAVPLVLDTATIDGRDGSVIVTAGNLDPTGRPTTLHVVAVGQECNESDVLEAKHWDLPLR